MERWIGTYPENSIARKAFIFASEAHKDTTRASGDPYITHCVAVARTVNEWRLDEQSVAAAFLHDVVEDTVYTNKDVTKEFGEEIASLVDGLTKLKHFKYGANPDAENLRKLILSFSNDLRVILIKLADRYHNMQTLQFLAPEKQSEIAWETMEIYAPIAYRLGMQKLSGELEDFVFPFLHKEEHEWLLNSVKERFEERAVYTERIKPIIWKTLEKEKIHPVSIDSRVKHYYSLYRKLMRNEMDLEKIYDLVAFRIIVKTVEECYATLGVIHKHWAPLPGRFKDYISRPKPNGYKSLHTTVFCVDNKITEIQIKTQEMHKENEFGIAAHWAYEQIKDSKDVHKKWAGVKNHGEVMWVEQLRNWQKSFINQKDFLKALKVDFFKERIFVITPMNDVIDLPAGATPIDFAYQIHSEIGNQCVGARVNGKIVPLTYELQSGDLVEILTQYGKKPSEDWLRLVKTSMAKKYIKSALRSKIKKLQKKINQELLEFKITGTDRPGYLKEITSMFAEAKINITYLQSQTDPRLTFSLITLRCGMLPKVKLNKILVNLKKTQGTNEVSYKYVR